MEDHAVVPTVGTCDCGNAATEGSTCPWCIPHDHEYARQPHQFSWPAVICYYCGLMAQDCCEKSSECPGITVWGTPLELVDEDEFCPSCEHSTEPQDDGTRHYEGCQA